MVPKVVNPTSLTNLRPIAYCNTLYKCITKVLCERLKPVLHWLVESSQDAFIEGRYILHNGFLCEDQVKFYHRKNISARCIIKMDIKKAYDTMSWHCLEQLLLHYGSPLACVVDYGLFQDCWILD